MKSKKIEFISYSRFGIQILVIYKVMNDYEELILGEINLIGSLGLQMV